MFRGVGLGNHVRGLWLARFWEGAEGLEVWIVEPLGLAGVKCGRGLL